MKRGQQLAGVEGEAERGVDEQLEPLVDRALRSTAGSVVAVVGDHGSGRATSWPSAAAAMAGQSLSPTGQVMLSAGPNWPRFTSRKQPGHTNSLAFLGVTPSGVSGPRVSGDLDLLLVLSRRRRRRCGPSGSCRDRPRRRRGRRPPRPPRSRRRRRLLAGRGAARPPPRRPRLGLVLDDRVVVDDHVVDRPTRSSSSASSSRSSSSSVVDVHVGLEVLLELVHVVDHIVVSHVVLVRFPGESEPRRGSDRHTRGGMIGTLRAGSCDLEPESSDRAGSAGWSAALAPHLGPPLGVEALEGRLGAVVDEGHQLGHGLVAGLARRSGGASPGRPGGRPGGPGGSVRSSSRCMASRALSCITKRTR